MFSIRSSNEFRVALHLFKAGEEKRGLDVLLREIEVKQTQLSQNQDAFYKYIHSLPHDWIDTYYHALSLCQKEHLPRKMSFLLKMDVIHLSWIDSIEDTTILYNGLKRL